MTSKNVTTCTHHLETSPPQQIQSEMSQSIQLHCITPLSHSSATSLRAAKFTRPSICEPSRAKSVGRHSSLLSSTSQRNKTSRTRPRQSPSPSSLYFEVVLVSEGGEAGYYTEKRRGRSRRKRRRRSWKRLLVYDIFLHALSLSRKHKTRNNLASLA